MKYVCDFIAVFQKTNYLNFRPDDGPRPKLLSPCFRLVNIFEEYEAKAFTVSFNSHTTSLF